MKWVVAIWLILLVACSGDLSSYVQRSEIITVLQVADEKITAKFLQLDRTIKRLERQIKRRKSDENG